MKKEKLTLIEKYNIYLLYIVDTLFFIISLILLLLHNNFVILTSIMLIISICITLIINFDEIKIEKTKLNLEYKDIKKYLEQYLKDNSYKKITINENIDYKIFLYINKDNPLRKVITIIDIKDIKENIIEEVEKILDRYLNIKENIFIIPIICIENKNDTLKNLLLKEPVLMRRIKKYIFPLYIDLETTYLHFPSYKINHLKVIKSEMYDQEKREIKSMISKYKKNNEESK